MLNSERFVIFKRLFSLPQFSTVVSCFSRNNVLIEIDSDNEREPSTHVQQITHIGGNAEPEETTNVYDNEPSAELVNATVVASEDHRQDNQ